MKIKRSPSRKAQVQLKGSVLNKPFPTRFWTIQMLNGENLPHQYTDAHCVFNAVPASQFVKLWVIAPNGVKLHASAFVRLGQIPFHSHHHEKSNIVAVDWASIEKRVVKELSA